MTPPPYQSSNTTVIRQHADWIVQTGVDFILIDWSNNLNSWTKPGGYGYPRTLVKAFKAGQALPKVHLDPDQP